MSNKPPSTKPSIDGRLPGNRAGDPQSWFTSDLIEIVFETTQIEIAVLDPAFTILRVNKAYAEARDREESYFVGKRFFELFPNDKQEQIFRKVVETGKPYSVTEDCLEHKDDTARGARYWNWDLIPVGSETEKVSTLILMAVEVTSRMRAQELNLRLVEAVEHLDEGVMVTDPLGTINYVNPALAAATGYPQSELVGRGWKDLEARRQSSGLSKDRDEKLAEGRAWNGRLRRRRKNGSFYEADITMSPVVDKHNEVAGFVSMERDVTERLRIEEGIRQIQKLEALGTLAGGIAHDFNNILMPIILNSEMLEDDFRDNDDARTLVGQIRQAARRGQNLIRQILAFSRHDEKPRQPTHLIPIIEESVGFLRASLPSSIRIETKISTAHDMIIGDPTQLQQIIMNLCKNAADALNKEPKVLLVSLHETPLKQQDLITAPRLNPGKYLKLAVSDTGIGIDPEILDRIFEPFFTMKDAGEGAGMGLAVVHGIVKSHGGMITVQSQLGAGSTFSVFLPLVDETSLRNEAIKGAYPKGTESILIIDDEALIAGSMTVALKRLGYDATAVTDSTDAASILTTQPEAYDLMICDQSMPGMNGMELIERVRGILPEIPIIICTGHPGTIDRDRCAALGVSDILIKPVDMAKLATATRTALVNADNAAG